MIETENLIPPNPLALEKSKLLTYGGKVDENLMNMLREAQKTAGVKRFADFMQDMLKIYRDNKQETEPPQLQVIKKAVTDIITTTESLLAAMQIIEGDKFSAIAEYRQRLQDAEENALKAADKIAELEKSITTAKADLAQAQKKNSILQTELTTEFARRKSIEGIINRVQKSADEAAILQEKAIIERAKALELADEAKNKAAILAAANKEMQAKDGVAQATIERSLAELAQQREYSKELNDKLASETIARNRLEERLAITEPQYYRAMQQLESLQSEINSLRLSEQAAMQRAASFEAELKRVRD